MSTAVAIARLTGGQPFCAGLLLWRGERLVFSLAKPKRWYQNASGRWCIDVACVGGGQEPGETVEQCARREALEETGRPVVLQSARRTRWRDLSGSERFVEVTDPVAPVSVELRPGPQRPYREGLPTGPILYVVHYIAQLSADPLPGDVPALIEVPAATAPLLCAGLAVSEALSHGVVIHEWTELPRDAVLVIPPQSPEERFALTACDLTARRG